MHANKVGYGRKVNANRLEYMEQIRKAPDNRKRSFQEVEETATQTEEPLSKRCFGGFQLPSISPENFYNKSSGQKRKQLFDEEENSNHSVKRKLPTPPSENEVIELNPFPKTRNQRRRLKRRNQKAQAINSAVEAMESSTISKLPTPPPSEHESSKSEDVQEQESNDENPSRQELKGIELVTAAVNMIEIHAGGSAIERLSYKVRKKIMSHVFGNSKNVKPGFMKGALPMAHHTPALDDEGVASSDNIDLSVLRTCKAFHQAGADAFYSENEFQFGDPTVCS